MSLTKRYLGDGVYVEVQREMFKLTTENGMNVTNTIFLEPGVYHALVKYAKEVFAFYAAERKKEQEAL